MYENKHQKIDYFYKNHADEKYFAGRLTEKKKTALLNHQKYIFLP